MMYFMGIWDYQNCCRCGRLNYIGNSVNVDSTDEEIFRRSVILGYFKRVIVFLINHKVSRIFILNLVILRERRALKLVTAVG